MSLKILRTESKFDLVKLLANAEGMNPSDFIERKLVNDIAHRTWEIRRDERVKTGILDSALRKPLAQILNEILLPPSATMAIKCWMSSQHLLHEWMLDLEGKRQVASLLEEAGVMNLRSKRAAVPDRHGIELPDGR
jgi:hypothetical protein